MKLYHEFYKYINFDIELPAYSNSSQDYETKNVNCLWRKSDISL